MDVTHFACFCSSQIATALTSTQSSGPDVVTPSSGTDTLTPSNKPNGKAVTPSVTTAFVVMLVLLCFPWFYDLHDIAT